MQGLKKAARGLCATAMLGALGFGAAQALATPAEASTTASACTSMTCGTACFKKGYSHWSCSGSTCLCSHGPLP